MRTKKNTVLIFLLFLCAGESAAQRYCHDYADSDHFIYAAIDLYHWRYYRQENIRKGISINGDLRFNFFTIFRKKYDGKFMIKDAVDLGLGVGGLSDPSGAQKGFTIIPLSARYGFSFIKRQNENQYMAFRVQWAGEYLEHFEEDKTPDGNLLNTSRMIYAFSYSWPRIILEANAASPAWFRGDPERYYSNKGFGFRAEAIIAPHFFVNVGYDKVLITMRDSNPKSIYYYNNYKPTMNMFRIGLGMK